MADIEIQAPDRLVFKTASGATAGAISVRETAEGNPQLILEDRNGEPMAAFGGDRMAFDIQLTPRPVDKPREWLELGLVREGVSAGVPCGNIHIGRSLLVGLWDACVDGNGVFAVPADPNGCILIAQHEVKDVAGNAANDRPLIRMFWKRQTGSNPPTWNGAVEERARMGIDRYGDWFVAGWMQAAGLAMRAVLSLRCWSSQAQVRVTRPDTGAVFTFGFDNSNLIKLVEPSGKVIVPSQHTHPGSEQPPS